MLTNGQVSTGLTKGKYPVENVLQCSFLFHGSEIYLTIFILMSIFRFKLVITIFTTEKRPYMQSDW